MIYVKLNVHLLSYPIINLWAQIYVEHPGELDNNLIQFIISYIQD